MTTEEDKAAALASIDEAMAKLNAVKAAVNAWPTDGPPPPPPPPDQYIPQNVTATGEAGAVRLRWSVPPGAEPLTTFIAWGDTAFIDKANVPAGTTEYAVPGLRAGTQYSFDIGFIIAGKVGQMARVTGTPSGAGPDDGGDGGDYPATGSWQARRDFVKANAGCSGTLRTIDSGAALIAAGLPGTWSGGIDGGRWTVPECRVPFRDLNVKGLVFYTGAQPLEMENVRCEGVQYSEGSGKQGGRFYRVTVVRNPALGLGQGCINMWGQNGWVVDHCNVSGFSDGFQVSGAGIIRDTWVHDLAYGTTPSGIPTHNDGVQNYGGTTRLERCVIEMGGVAASTNGALFCSKPEANFTAFDLFAEVTRADVNILHAWQSPVGITVNGGRLSTMGRLIGKVVLNNVVRE